MLLVPWTTQIYIISGPLSYTYPNTVAISMYLGSQSRPNSIITNEALPKDAKYLFKSVQRYTETGDILKHTDSTLSLGTFSFARV